MCEHTFITSDYDTHICSKCGLELQSQLSPSEGYTENMPLELGYSRYNRMTALLNKLFEPKLYGNPNSRVVYEVLQQKFENGSQLQRWLSTLPVKNKRYQNAHYYFSVHKPYKVPTPPCKRKVLEILRVFSNLEHRFECWKHLYKSFFSYNWLLRKLLKIFELEMYIPFVKQIKCKKRVRLYESMYTFFMSSGNAGVTKDASQTCQIQPSESQGDDFSYHPALRVSLNRLVRNRQNN